MPDSRQSLRRSKTVPWIIAAAAAALALLGLYLLSRRGEEPAPPAPEAPQAAVTDAGPPAAAPTAAPGPVDAERSRSLLEAISKNLLVRRALAGADLMRRVAVVLDNLAGDESPRRALAGFGPKRPFAVVTRGNASFIGPGAYQRYDDFAEAVSSVDPQALAAAYGYLHGPLEAAYRALGYPDASLDPVLAQALQRLEAAPVRDGDVEVVPEEGVYVFADPRLEQEGEVEKHLLRMGPRNTRLIKSKAREIREALALPAATPTGAKR